MIKRIATALVSVALGLVFFISRPLYASAAPMVPPAPNVSNITFNSAEVNFGLGALGNPPTTTYRVLFRTEAGRYQELQPGGILTDFPRHYFTADELGGMGGIIIQHLNVNTRYEVYVFVTDEFGFSFDSPHTAFSTLPGPQGAELAYVINKVTPNQEVTWYYDQAKQGTETHFVVFDSENGGAFVRAYDSANLDESSYEFTNRKPSTLYQYQVGTVDENGVISYLVTTNQKYSLALPAGNPTQDELNTTTSTLALIIHPNVANSSSTRYMLMMEPDITNDPLLDDIYSVAPDGTLPETPDESVWLTAQQWANMGVLKIVSLKADTTYGFTMVAKNQENDWSGFTPEVYFKTKAEPVLETEQNNGGNSGLGGSFSSPPTYPSISVLKETLNLASTTVELSLFANDNPQKMILSANKDFSGASFVPYATTSVWNFSGAKAEQTVYAQFANAGGVSATVSVVVPILPADQKLPPKELEPQVLGTKVSRLAELIGQTRFGEKSEAVTELQKLLQENGYFSVYFKPTGYFGPLTRAAVQKHQADQLTLDELVVKTTFGQSGYAVYRLQSQLVRLGFMPKNWRLTYFYGPVTKAGVAKYLATK